MSTVIHAENISKQYRLGQVGAGALQDDLKRWWQLLRGKEDPFLKIGEENDRTKISDSDYVWSLKDINFQLEQGDVLGIIGRNGAGKSTLLKILSRITTPTTGSIRIQGRVASLLEVGTGFHPDLTGRENIFLNGAIMGMSRNEIQSKIDEIISFSGVEKYIDTPVKRYSSGMYVRLAFAVAAHLEPEILIIDEVLAVGDAEFQKKCLGKMKDVSGAGRTVLFVSHNMAAVQELCNKGMFLHNGQIQSFGSIDATVKDYMTTHLITKLENTILQKNIPAQITKAWINFEHNREILTTETPFKIHFEASCMNENLNLNFSMTLMNGMGQTVFNSLSESIQSKKGIIRGICQVPGNLLNNGLFTVTIVLARDRSICEDMVEEVLVFEVLDQRDNEPWFGDISNHLIRPKLNWEIHN
jgi:lipopolysaccharide transport system ATP-binding protein